MRYFQVTARYIRHDRQWTTSIGLPTFFLRADVQMILTSAQAAVIARQMIAEMTSARPEDIHGEVIDTRPDGMTGDDFATL